MKVPCGGFDLDESVFNVDKNSKQIKLNSPISYDYMPEGYPKKKDGWSVEWDGNIDGKTSAIGAPLYKFSDRVLTYEEFLSAMVVRYQDGESYSKMVQEASPEQSQVTDAVSSFICSFGGEIQVLVVSEDNVEANGIIFPTKGLYIHKDKIPFKLIKVTITPMSADFMPKNLNVVFILDTSGDTNMYSCNVTYSALRGWMNRHIPVVATIYVDTDEVHIISSIVAYSNYLQLAYTNIHGDRYKIVYNSDGSIGVSAS